jgi:peptide-methionine (S)-S-oxide reductase
MNRATFAAGCFWGVEDTFRKTPGVTATQVGYIGGTTAKPSYEQVCSGRTGHAEAVEVEFDPQQISYERLLEVFWQLHDPTTLNRQGPDIGTQYRSAIFTHSAEQERAALASRDIAQAGSRRKIVTEITASPVFYRAEEYHQKYYDRHATVCAPRF